MHRQTATAESILRQMRLVQQLRDQRHLTAGLDHAVSALKRYQQQRFAHSHADFFSSARYGPGIRFFLSELYGPGDFSNRDAQFSRLIPTLVKLFPQEIVNTVQTLADLHALSELLDNEMGLRLNGKPLTAAAYAQAWQAVGCPDERER